VRADGFVVPNSRRYVLCVAPADCGGGSVDQIGKGGWEELN
jgi:hypothetical protein